MMLLTFLLLSHTAASTPPSTSSSNSLPNILNNLDNGSDFNGVAGVLVESRTGFWLVPSSLQLSTSDFDGNDYQDDEYEYKEDLDEGVDSGGLDPEVGGKKFSFSPSSRNATVAKVISRVHKMQ